MSEDKTQEFDNSNEAGAIWIREKNDKQQLNIVVNGVQLNGFENEKRIEGSKAPDFNIVQYVDNVPKDVGAAWIGETKQGNKKLNMKLKLDGKEEYYTAVKRKNKPENSKAADMTIFVPSSAETLEAAKTAEESAIETKAAEPEQKTKTKSL